SACATGARRTERGEDAGCSLWWCQRQTRGQSTALCPPPPGVREGVSEGLFFLAILDTLQINPAARRLDAADADGYRIAKSQRAARLAADQGRLRLVQLESLLPHRPRWHEAL